MDLQRPAEDTTPHAGPVLRSGDIAQVVIEALAEDNPDKELVVGDHAGYIRVEAPGGLTLRRETVELLLGREFRMQELEITMTGFSGKIETTTDHVRWYFASDAAPTGPPATAPPSR